MSTEENIAKWLRQLKKYRTTATEVEPEGESTITKKAEDISQEDFRTLIEKEAYFISLNALSTDELTWLLAERRLVLQKGYENVTEDDIRALAEEIHHSGCSRDELCWLNAELMVLHREHLLE